MEIVSRAGRQDERLFPVPMRFVDAFCIAWHPVYLLLLCQCADYGKSLAEGAYPHVSGGQAAHARSSVVWLLQQPKGSVPTGRQCKNRRTDMGSIHRHLNLCSEVCRHGLLALHPPA